MTAPKQVEGAEAPVSTPEQSSPSQPQAQTAPRSEEIRQAILAAEAEARGEAPERSAPAPEQPPSQPAVPAAPAEPVTPAQEAISAEWQEKLRRDAEDFRTQKALKEMREEHARLRAEAEERDRLLAQDPYAFAQKYLPKNFYEQMTERLINDGKAKPEQELSVKDREIQELRQRLEMQERQKAEAEQNQALQGYMSEAAQVMQDEKYALTRSWPGVENEIIDLVAQWHNVYGQVLPASEAIAKIDAVVRQRWQQLQQAAGTASPQPEGDKKPSAKSAPAPKQATPGTPATEPKTLTNEMASGALDIPDDIPWEEQKRRLANQITWL